VLQHCIPDSFDRDLRTESERVRVLLVLSLNTGAEFLWISLGDTIPFEMKFSMDMAVEK
jgi:hypothetical protein